MNIQISTLRTLGQWFCLGFIFVLFLCFVRTDGAFAAEGLEISSQTQLKADPSGTIKVNIDVAVKNRDQGTKLKQFGVSYYYDAISVQIVHGFQNLRVTSAGIPVSHSVKRTYHDLPISVLEITSPKKLFYGDEIGLSISYEIGTMRTDDLFVTPNYMYVPIFTSANNNSSVEISVPSGYSTIVNGLDCTGETSGEEGTRNGQGLVRCSPEPTDLGWAEIMDPSSRVSITDSTTVAGVEYPMEIQYFQGEEAWANHVKELIKQAIPLLHSEYSAPLPGKFKIVVKETGLGETQGYGGRFACDNRSEVCQISALPPQSDSTIVHETSHLWSYLYSSTWLAEGFAQFTTENLSRTLNYEYEAHEADTSNYANFPLDVWTNPEDVLTSTTGEQESINIYYAKSADFLRTLQRAVGDNSLRLANKQLASQETIANSPIFMDAIESTSNVDLDGLFIAWVFGEAGREKIKHRRSTINRIEQLEKELKPLSLEIPSTVSFYRKQWDFVKADREIDRASSSLANFRAAKEKMDEKKSPVQKVISMAAPPEKIYQVAAGHFQNGEYQRAETVVLQIVKLYEYAPLIALWLSGIITLIVLLFLVRKAFRKP